VVETYQILRYPEMFTGILAMGMLGVTLYFIVSSIEFRVNRHLFLED
jgi:NitT/TauT family transport system permease protein